jgi:hypothetical protein
MGRRNGNSFPWSRSEEQRRTWALQKPNDPDGMARALAARNFYPELRSGFVLNGGKTPFNGVSDGIGK